MRQEQLKAYIQCFGAALESSESSPNGYDDKQRAMGGPLMRQLELRSRVVPSSPQTSTLPPSNLGIEPDAQEPRGIRNSSPFYRIAALLAIPLTRGCRVEGYGFAIT
jgi:hypothetical protein